MYLYIDESGDFGTNPANLKKNPFFVIAVLVVWSKKAKKELARAVKLTLPDYRKLSQRFKRDPSWFPKEVHALDLNPWVREKLFRRMRGANFQVFFIMIDKRRLTDHLPKEYWRRYSMVAMNILAAIPIPKHQKWITMVIDKGQSSADPTTPTKHHYKTKRERLIQKQLRVNDRRLMNIYRNSIVSAYRVFLRKTGMHLSVHFVQSQNDPCLQVVDVLAHFAYERLFLNEERRDLKDLAARFESKDQWERDKRWKRVQEHWKNWKKNLKILRPRWGLVYKPLTLKRRSIAKLESMALRISTQRQQRRKKGNP